MQANMNNALMGILRVQHLTSPPYLTADPSVNMLRVDPDDQFLIIGSDGLFDFFTNDEVVNHIHQFLCDHPAGDPAKFMIDHLLLRVADNAGIMLISCISQSMIKLWFRIFLKKFLFVPDLCILPHCFCFLTLLCCSYVFATFLPL
jgi:pyruvate dehydrogenase phosphatase